MAGPGGRQGRLRIIGGEWRGRKLAFTPAPGLRPTTDRVRETLFNWLSPALRGAVCADLFAGSGALGLEALSRGASHCDFVDCAAGTLRQIGAHLANLGAVDRSACHAMTADRFLRETRRSYDIVFIDPPYGSSLPGLACALLAGGDRLCGGALVYVETAAGEALPALPGDWRKHREKLAGGVCYRLFVVGGGQID
jgi:16S rRNA (guanine966-N2)-methyltransferase